MKITGIGEDRSCSSQAVHVFEHEHHAQRASFRGTAFRVTSSLRRSEAEGKSYTTYSCMQAVAMTRLCYRGTVVLDS